MQPPPGIRTAVAKHMNLFRDSGRFCLPHSAAVRGLQSPSLFFELIEHVCDAPMVGPLSWRELSQSLEPLLD